MYFVRQKVPVAPWQSIHLQKCLCKCLAWGASVMRNGRTLGGPSLPTSQLGVRYSGVSGARDFGGNLVFRSHGIRYVAWA